MSTNKVNSGLTLVDVRTVLMDTITDLKSGKTDIKTAAEIRNLSNSMIDIAKTQVEYIKALPNSIKEQMKVNEVKAIAGTLIDRDAELDQSLVEIQHSMRKPIETGKK
jgi:hypothetical protein